MRLVSEDFRPVYETEKPVVLLVSAKGCLPCQQMKTVIKAVEPEFPWVDFFELHEASKGAPEHPIVVKLDVQWFPTIFYIDKSNGKDSHNWCVFKAIGGTTKADFTEKIKACFKSYTDDKTSGI